MHPSTFFHYCPRCGVAAGDQKPSGPFNCGGCGFHYYFNPANAAAAFVIREDGRVLFIHRAKDPAKGLLALPGGFIDAGETAEEAVRREVKEEVGLEIEHLEYLGSHPNLYLYREVTYPVLDFFFTARVRGTRGVCDAEEVAGMDWLLPEKVRSEDVAFASVRAALAALVKARSEG